MSTLDDFLEAPSEFCITEFCITDHYIIKLTLPKSAKKDQLAEFIRESLKEKQVLPGGTPVEATSLVALTSMFSSQTPKSIELTFEQQQELLQMQLEQRKSEA